MRKSLILTALLVLPALAQAQAPGPAKAIFAGGCFWCVEEAFEMVPGVLAAVSGYTDGRTKNPTYEQVGTGLTGHTEAVEVTYDPAKVSYEKLLEVFWVNHDPTVLNRQFCDGGSQYRPGIYWLSDEQRRLAEASKTRWEREKPFREKILTPIVKASQFWPAEEYHQDYYKKNPARYRFYVTGCGRYARLDELWGKYRKK
jgi:peptide-methionine (S)-S-oxide reductase